MAMLIEASQARGRILAFNGVCGNLGAALAAGITAALASAFSWRAAFLVPAALCVATGIFYVLRVPDDHRHGQTRKSSIEARLSPQAMIVLFGCFTIVALAAGLSFNVISVALPKLLDERLGQDVPLMLVGGLATAVFMCGALAQLAVGRLSERFAPHVLFAIIAVIEFAAILWSAYATGPMLLLALAVSMAALYGQVTVNDMVVARYTADAWRGRVYAVRYFLIFVSAGAAVGLIAYLHKNGGFELVLLASAGVAFVLLVGVLGIVAIVSGAERARAAAAIAPAE
jgi:MFS family permease